MTTATPQQAISPSPDAGSHELWEIADSTTLRDKTVEVLRDAILSHHFKPGQKLVERVLTEATGVSRTSVREALSQLQAEGLVMRVANKGMYVTRVTETEARQIYEMRSIIESAMARLFVARANEDHIAALELAVANAERLNQPDDALMHARQLDEVSDAIMRGAGNDVALQINAVLRARITYLRTITSRSASAQRRTETMAMLHAIIEAFRNRDADLAEQLVRGYVDRSAKYGQEVLLEYESDHM